jgi:hypothetical protein
MTTEYRNQCGQCRKRRRSRIYWRMIGGTWLYLYGECWDKEEQSAE